MQKVHLSGASWQLLSCAIQGGLHDGAVPGRCQPHCLLQIRHSRSSIVLTQQRLPSGTLSHEIPVRSSETQHVSYMTTLAFSFSVGAAQALLKVRDQPNRNHHVNRGSQ